MPTRGMILIAAAGMLAGCANENAVQPASMALVQPAKLGAGAIAKDLDADLKRAEKQTVSAKMLAAIALQRVTGRAPDPARFKELR